MNTKNEIGHFYDDIIDLPHHVSTTRPHMHRMERAAQFSAFAALTGYGDAIHEVERQTQERIELDETQKQELGERLKLLQAAIQQGPNVVFTYFSPNQSKSGGAYLTVRGVVKKLRELERLVVLEDGTVIPIDEIYSMEGELFRCLDEDV